MNDKKLEELRNQFEQSDLSADIDAAEWDTKVEVSPMVGITVRLPAELLQQVREAAAAEGVKTTALIRKWIEENIQARAASAQSSGSVWTLIYSAVVFSNDDDEAVHDIKFPRDFALTA